MSWEETFASWAKPPGQTEQDKMDNAASAVEKALRLDDALNERNIRIIPQGSFRNKTNIKQESDVDICALCTNTFYFELPTGTTREAFGLNSPATYHDAEYRADIDRALRSRFGSSNVVVGNKAWNINENTYRVDADVVAAFQHREYFANGDIRYGVAILPKVGDYILNYPEQNYEKGKKKNDITQNRFRSCVRILKNLSAFMKEQGTKFSELPSFLIESLVYNVPSQRFGHSSLTDDIRWILAHLFNETRTDETCKEWTEVNGIKYLFHSTQKWTRPEANSFLNTAWNYVGFR